MKHLLTALIILFIAHNSFSQSEVAFLSASHKVSPMFAQLKFSGSAEDSTATGKTVETPDALTTIPTFYAKRNKKNVELTWQPASEESRSVFIIQRKTAGDWETIAYVPCSSTSNDQLPSVYTFIDVNTSKSETQYQVKEEIDHGKTRPSAVLAVQPERSNSFVAALSQSGKIRLAFKTDDMRDIKIYNDKGQLVKEANHVCGKNIEVAVPSAGTLHLLALEQSTGAIAVGEVYIR